MGYYEWLPERDHIRWSDNLIQLYGLTEAPSVEHGFTACVHPEDRVRVEAETSAFLADGDSYSHEFRIVRPDGTIRHVHDRGTIERNADGKVTRMAGINIDITDQVGAQEARPTPQQEDRAGQLALFAKHAPIGIAMFDTEMNYMAVSERYIADFRLPPGVQMVGRSHYDVFPEISGRWRDIHARVLAGETLSAQDDPFPRRSGTVDYVRWSMSPWYAADRTIGGAFLVAEVIAAEARNRQDREEQYRQISKAMDVAGLGYGLVDFGTGEVELDPEARRLFGMADTGGPISQDHLQEVIHPEDRDAVLRASDRALDPAGNGLLDVEHRVVHPAERVRWVRARGKVHFAAGPEGPVAKHGILTVRDVSERAEAVEALRESESFARTTLEANPDCIMILDHGAKVIFANQMACEHTALHGSSDLIGEAWAGLWSKEDEVAVVEALKRARTGEPQHLELRSLAVGGEDIWAEVRLTAIGSPSAPFDKFMAVCRDVTRRKRDESRLQAAHDSFKQLIEQSPLGIYTVDEELRFTQVSAGAAKAFAGLEPIEGRHLEDVMRTIWPDELASEIVKRFRHTLETGEPYSAPRIVEERLDDRGTESYEWQIQRILLPGGAPGVVCYFYDLSERERYETQVRVVMQEVAHRSKNLLSIVQAVAMRTASDNPEDFVEKFQKRIRSMASAQDLLVGGNWHGVSMRDLVKSQLAHFGDFPDHRISVSGPELTLQPGTAQNIGMAFHELATNAAKYGALSTDSGSVAIIWSVDDTSAGEPELRMSWSESGGPVVAPPERAGFGATVIKTIVESSLSARVELNYAAEGFAWSMVCPLASAVVRWESRHLANKSEDAGTADSAN